MKPFRDPISGEKMEGGPYSPRRNPCDNTKLQRHYVLWLKLANSKNIPHPFFRFSPNLRLWLAQDCCTQMNPLLSNCMRFLPPTTYTMFPSIITPKSQHSKLEGSSHAHLRISSLSLLLPHQWLEMISSPQFCCTKDSCPHAAMSTRAFGYPLV